MIEVAGVVVSKATETREGVTDIFPSASRAHKRRVLTPSPELVKVKFSVCKLACKQEIVKALEGGVEELFSVRARLEKESQ